MSQAESRSINVVVVVVVVNNFPVAFDNQFRFERKKRL